MTAKTRLFTILVWLFATAAQAQSSHDLELFPNRFKGRHSISFAAMGSGTAGGLHYEYRFSPDNRGFGVRIGIGFGLRYTESLSRKKSDGTYEDYKLVYPGKWTFPFGINYLIGRAKNPHRIEVGLGYTYVAGDAVLFDHETTDHAVLLVGTVGYRRYYFDSRLMWRVAFTPVISLAVSEDPYPVPWAEAAIGYRF